MPTDAPQIDAPSTPVPAPSGGNFAKARGATVRRQIINVPARLAAPQRRRVLHLPSHWPWAQRWTALWHAVLTDTGPPLATT